jgi:glycosyltransferase involved in cell wall biosynthesis
MIPILPITMANVMASVGSGALRIESKPQGQGIDPARAKPRSWRVIHACEFARDVLPVVEGQVAAGMRPYIVTPQGGAAAEIYLAQKDLEQPHPLSLLRAWQDVRNWRKALLECDPENSADVVHTHSFASGMAAVRNFSCVVYDPAACIEELAIASGQCDSASWMARSFRVAEQFVISRAEAVIVHSSGMKLAVEERGAASEGVFVIPAPLEPDLDDVASPRNSFLRDRFGIASTTLTYFVPELRGAERHEVSGSVSAVLEAFAQAAAELPPAALLVEASASAREALRGHAEQLKIADRVFIFGSQEAESVMRNADVVIVTGELPSEPVTVRLANDLCLKSLWFGKALLAADVPRNRDCSPDGRGCLWFKDGDVRDLSTRIGFLAGHPDFRTALAQAGRSYLVETRSSAAIGRMYDNAYKHALSRKKSGGTGQNNATSLQPLTSSGW